jgi:hypothetical protein
MSWSPTPVAFFNRCDTFVLQPEANRRLYGARSHDDHAVSAIRTPYLLITQFNAEKLAHSSPEGEFVMPTPKWKFRNDAWHAKKHGDKLIVQCQDDYYRFSWSGPDSMTPPMTDFSQYTFETEDEAKDAALKHHSWYGGDNAHRFDEWYQQNREFSED